MFNEPRSEMPPFMPSTFTKYATSKLYCFLGFWVLRDFLDETWVGEHILNGLAELLYFRQKLKGNEAQWFTWRVMKLRIQGD